MKYIPYLKKGAALATAFLVTAGALAACQTTKPASIETSIKETKANSSETEEEPETTTVIEDITTGAETESAPEETTSSGLESEDAEAALETYCQELFESAVASNTLNLHYIISDPEAYGIEYEVSLGSWYSSEEEEKIETEQSRQETESDLYLLRQIDRDALSSSSQVLYDTLIYYLELDLEYSDLEFYEEPLSTTSGDHINLPIIMAEYVFYSERDVEDYLILIEDMPRYFDTIIAYETAKADAGMFMSDELAEEVISQCEDFLADPENNSLLLTLEDRLNTLDLTDEEKEDWTEKITTAVQDSAVPAYHNLIDALTDLKDHADNPDADETGLSRLPEGKEYYEYLLKTNVGTDRTPEELKKWLNRELNSQLRILQRYYTMDVYEDSIDFDDPDALTDPLEILADLQEKALTDFPSVSGTSYTVKYVPTALEDSTSPAYYLLPPIDRSDDNIIYINQKTTDVTSLYTTLAHEGYPGHLLQTVYFNRISQNTGGSTVRRLLSPSGYVEGWANYVELQAYNWVPNYETNTSKAMAANYQASLIIQALMDIGVNYDGWSEQDLGEYALTYFDMDEENVHDLYLLLIGEPSNTLNYVIGSLEWMDLRDECEASWDHFTAMEFHEKALEIGPTPFPILRSHMLSDTDTE